MDELDPFRRRRRPRLPAEWAPWVGRGLPAAQIRIMLWLGLLLGLLAAQVARQWPLPVAAPDAERSEPVAAPSADALLAGRIRVIDGDTFDYGGMRVRIADIDTAEVNGRCAYETDLAARATGRLRELLAGGDIAMHPLPGGRDEDRYGRKLRIVTLGGRSVGDVLVAEGLARIWTGRRQPWCA